MLTAEVSWSTSSQKPLSPGADDTDFTWKEYLNTNCPPSAMMKTLVARTSTWRNRGLRAKRQIDRRPDLRHPVRTCRMTKPPLVLILSALP